MLLYSYMKNYYQQLNYIFQNVQILFGFLGIVNQLLIICVFHRKRLRNHSYAFYSITMACFDLIACLHTFRHWAAFMFDANLDLVAQFFCAIGEYQPYAAGTSSLWILVLVSLDRLVTIVYPNRLQLIKKRWFQAVLVMIVIVCNLLIHIQLPLYYTLQTLNDSNRTVCSIPYNVFNIHNYIYLFNFKMIHFLIKTRNALNLNNSNRRSAIRDRKFAISAIGVNVANFVSKMPLGIAVLVTNYLNLNYDQFTLLFTICVTIATLYDALSFGIYLLVNSIFYDEFCLMIGLR